MTLGCIIMAAGGSSRFGSNKLLQTVREIPLYRRAVQAVPEGIFDRVVVVTGYSPVAEAAKEYGFTVVINDCPEQGISRTIRLGLEQLADCDGVLFMTADQPYLTGATLRKLTEAFAARPDAIHAAAHNGVRGNPCLFPQDCFPALLRLEGDRGGGAVIAQNRHRLLLTEVPAEELADADTPQALDALRNTCGSDSFSV